MKFWDSSAVVPLLLEESATRAVSDLFRSDPTMLVAWTTPVECASALARAEHDGHLTPAVAVEAFARLDEVAAAWHEVEPANEVRDIARRLLRAHRLRAAGAMQLASATLAAERRPSTLAFVTLDERLEIAASREGFTVIVPGR